MGNRGNEKCVSLVSRLAIEVQIISAQHWRYEGLTKAFNGDCVEWSVSTDTPALQTHKVFSLR
jgi:hypothetical protein